MDERASPEVFICLYMRQHIPFGVYRILKNYDSLVNEEADQKSPDESRKGDL